MEEKPDRPIAEWPDDQLLEGVPLPHRQPTGQGDAHRGDLAAGLDDPRRDKRSRF